MNHEILTKLEIAFYPYAPFWDEWKNHPCNGLSPTNIYIIEVHVNNGFTADIEHLPMFFNQQRILADLIRTLNENYSEFQTWLIIKFQLSIIKLVRALPLDTFLHLPLNTFSNNQYSIFSERQLKVLLKFNCKTLHEIFASYSDEGFRRPDIFLIVAEFQALLEIDETIYLMLKKEVTIKNRNCTLN